MTVYDIIAACEFINCTVVDFFGHEIEFDVTDKESYEKIYQKQVEHIEARDNIILIFTFDNMNDLSKKNLRGV